MALSGPLPEASGVGLCCSGPVDTGTQSASTSGKQATTHPVWREAFHLCVGSVEQVLEVVVVHAAANGVHLLPMHAGASAAGRGSILLC